ncbi:hypothetical protein N7457_003440 [Penicillium paradoxum]|uniref:uncharacterized protein n=1 Tax=Penicillium paradoxum TaxID=176176 RepID=UPI0025485C88|nr:uncharacterized protein N7457_003440 [Penicillium paradoxum]KAJ5788450.1 hypothetical protein N7457_003440 [Penicillium paradoxum]
MASVLADRPDNSDWKEVIHAPVENQAVNLPELGSFILDKITPPLKEREDANEWIDKAEKILDSHNLHHLINCAVPWPKRNNPDGKKWMTLSKQVRAWLSASLDNEVMQEIRLRGNDIHFADEFMDEIHKHMKRDSHTAQRMAVKAFRTTSRSQFSSNLEFIRAVKRRYRAINDAKGEIPAYFALEIILEELDSVPEMKTFLDIKSNELNALKNPMVEITTVDLYQYAASIEDYIKLKGIDSYGE